MNSVLNLPNRQVKLGQAKMTLELVHASYSLPECQAVKLQPKACPAVIPHCSVFFRFLLRGLMTNLDSKTLG